MGHEQIQCLGHMPIAQIPRRHRPAKHCTVILLGVLDKPRVLFCEEEIVGRHPTIATCIVGSTLSQLNQLTDDLPLARFRQAKSSSITVGLGIFTKMFEARVAFARFPSRVGIDPVQVSNHGLH